MGERETRKLQQVGGSTLTVSLPKDWVDAKKLKSGDDVVFEEDGNSLRLQPLKEKEAAPVVCVIDAEQTETSLLTQCIIGGYILGYQTLEIQDSTGFDRDQINAIHTTMRELTGISIVEQEDTTIRLRNFMDVSDSSIYVIMRRLSTTVLHMLDSALYSLLQGRTDLLDDVSDMEQEVDVLYWLILRQLLTAIEDKGMQKDIGLKSPLHIIGNRTAIKALEGTADSIEDISTTVNRLNEDGYSLSQQQKEQLSEISEFIHQQIKTSVESLIEQDVQAAHDVIERNKTFDDLTAPFLDDSEEQSLHLHKIVWNLERIIEYSSFLAEITINRSMEENTTRTSIENI